MDTVLIKLIVRMIFVMMLMYSICSGGGIIVLTCIAYLFMRTAEDILDGR